MDLSEDVFWKYYKYNREDDKWDYKEQINISTKTEFANFAKDLLAFSNYGGGYLLLGIRNKDHTLVGIDKELDPANIGDTIEKRIGFNISIKLFYFKYTSDKDEIKLGILFIPPSDKMLISKKDHHGSDGKFLIQEGSIYYRRNTRSIKANTEDIQNIINRISFKKSNNEISVQNEPSLLLSLKGNESNKKMRSIDVLFANFEPNAVEFGEKLQELWRFNSNYSKFEFAKLINIPIEKIDGYFDGKELLELYQLLQITKIFNLENDFFFRPTYNMRFPYWSEDIVKFCILSLVIPKSNIPLINNKGTFYGHIFYDYATQIGKFHELLFGDDSPKNNLFDKNKESISEKLKSDLGHQYYKILEQYPSPLHSDRLLLVQEEILRIWFFADGEYIARLIIEGIQKIDIRDPERPIIVYKFNEDLKRKKVLFHSYDEKNLRMSST